MCRPSRTPPPEAYRGAPLEQHWNTNRAEQAVVGPQGFGSPPRADFVLICELQLSLPSVPREANWGLQAQHGVHPVLSGLRGVDFQQPNEHR